MQHGWYEISLIFGVGVLVFFAIMFFIGWREQNKRWIICKSCGQTFFVEDVEKHVKDNHFYNEGVGDRKNW